MALPGNNNIIGTFNTRGTNLYQSDLASDNLETKNNFQPEEDCINVGGYCYDRSSVLAQAAGQGMKILPPKKGAYHGVYPVKSGVGYPTKKDIQEYTKQTGQKPTIVLAFHSWQTGFAPLRKFLRDMHSLGITPFVKWEPRGINLAAIAHKDPAALRRIKKFAENIKSMPFPVMLSFAHEMNSPERTTRYAWAGRPGIFKQAWKVVHNIFTKEVKAKNITWAWVVNESAAEDIRSYYPGPEYVDWIGIDGYSFVGTAGRAQNIGELFGAPLEEVRTLGKPIMIAEFGMDEEFGVKDLWIHDIFEFIRKYRIAAFIYFNCVKDEDIPDVKESDGYRTEEIAWALSDEKCEYCDKESSLAAYRTEISKTSAPRVRKGIAIPRLPDLPEVEGICGGISREFNTIYEWGENKKACHKTKRKIEERPVVIVIKKLEREIKIAEQMGAAVELYAENIKVLEDSVRFVLTNNEKGNHKWAMGMLHRFIEVFKKLPDIGTEYPSIFKLLALCYAGLGEAEMWLIERTEANASTRNQAYNRAIEYLKTAEGYGLEALKLVKISEAARKKRPEFEPRAIMARVYFEMGNAFTYKAWTANEIWQQGSNPAHFNSVAVNVTRGRALYKKSRKYCSASNSGYDRIREDRIKIALARLTFLKQKILLANLSPQRLALLRKRSIPLAHIPELIKSLDEVISVAQQVYNHIPELNRRFKLPQDHPDKITLYNPGDVIFSELEIEAHDTIRKATATQLFLYKWMVDEEADRMSDSELQEARGKNDFLMNKSSELKNACFSDKFKGVKFKKRSFDYLNPRARLENIRDTYLTLANAHSSVSEQDLPFLRSILTWCNKALEEKFNIPEVYAAQIAALARIYFILKLKDHRDPKLLELAQKLAAAKPLLFNAVAKLGNKQTRALAQLWEAKVLMDMAGDMKKYKDLRVFVAERLGLSEAECVGTLGERKALQEIQKKLLDPAYNILNKIKSFDLQELNRTIGENFSRRAFIAKSLGDLDTYVELSKISMNHIDQAIRYGRKETRGEALLLKGNVLMAMSGEMDYKPYREFVAENLKIRNADALLGPRGALKTLKLIKKKFLDRGTKMVKYESIYEGKRMQGENFALQAFLYRTLRKHKEYKKLLVLAKRLLLSAAKGGRRITKGEAGSWLAKLVVVRVGDMDHGDVVRLHRDVKVQKDTSLDLIQVGDTVRLKKADGSKVTLKIETPEDKNQIQVGGTILWLKIAIDNDKELVAAQLWEIESVRPYVDAAAEILLGKTLAELNASKAEIDQIQGYLFKDLARFTEFRKASAEALVKMVINTQKREGDDPYPVGYTALYVIKSKVANFLTAVAADKENLILMSQQSEFQKLFQQYNITVSPLDSQEELEHKFLLAAARILKEVIDSGWLYGRNLLVAEKSYQSARLNLSYLYKDLVARKFVPEGKESIETSARALEKIYRTRGEKSKAFEIKTALERGDLSLPKTKIEEFIAWNNQELEAAQRVLTEKLLASERGDVVDEAQIILAKSKGVKAGEMHDVVKQRQDIITGVILPLAPILRDLDEEAVNNALSLVQAALEKENNPGDKAIIAELSKSIKGNERIDSLLRGRAKFDAWKTFIDSLKIVASITQGQQGYEWKDDTHAERVCHPAVAIFDLTKELYQKVLASERADINAQADSENYDISSILVGNFMDPDDQLPRLKEIREKFNELAERQSEGIHHITGRPQTVAQKRDAEIELREYFQIRQKEGRSGPSVKPKAAQVKASLKKLENTQRLEIASELNYDIAMKRFVEAADADKDPELDGRRLDVEHRILKNEVEEPIKKELKTKRLFARARENLIKLIQDTKARLGMILRIKEGKDSIIPRTYLLHQKDVLIEIAQELGIDISFSDEKTLEVAMRKTGNKLLLEKLGKPKTGSLMDMVNDVNVKPEHKGVKDQVESKYVLFKILAHDQGREKLIEKIELLGAQDVFEIVRSCGIREFEKETVIPEERLRLVLAADAENFNIELLRIEETIPGIMASLGDPNFSSRAQTDVVLLAVEAFARIGFLWKDLFSHGKKENVDKIYKILEELLEERIELKKERQELLAENADLSGIDTRLAALKPKLSKTISDLRTVVDDLEKIDKEKANYRMAKALLWLLDKVLFSKRADLEAIGDFWTGQILSVMAEDNKDMLHHAKDHLQVAFDSDELRGVQIEDAHIGIGLILGRIAGVENEEFWTAPWTVYGLASEATDHLLRSIQLIGDHANLNLRQRKQLEEAKDNLEKYCNVFVKMIQEPGQNLIPKEQWRKVGKILVETADILSWGKWDLETAHEYYKIARDLLRKVKARYEKEGIPIDSKLKHALGKAYTGLGDMRRYKNFKDIDFDLSFEYYQTSLFFLGVDIDKDGNVEKLEELKKLEKGEGAVSTTILTQIAKNYLGLGNLYANQDKSWGGKKLAEKYFDLCERTLKEIKAKGAPTMEYPLSFDEYREMDLDDIPEIGTWTAEHKQIQRMLVRDRQKFARIYNFQVLLSFFATQNKYGYASQGFNLKLELPFYDGLFRVILENEFKEVLGNKAWKPILAFAGHFGRQSKFDWSNLGSIDYGIGFPLGMIKGDPIEVRADLSLNFRNIVSLATSYRYLELMGHDSHSIYAGLILKPFPFLRTFFPCWFTNMPFLQGIGAGLDAVFYNDIFGERNGTQKWAHLLSLNVFGDFKFLQEWLGISAQLSIPLEGSYVSGIMNPGENDFVKDDAPYRGRIAVEINPTWEILEGYPSIGAFCESEFENFSFGNPEIRSITGGFYFKFNFK